MPSKNKQYNLVQSDDLDSRIPLMPEEAFQHGIPFNCKFIGSMDIPRPTSRVEIVAAMRRVRVEFKAKGVKKKKATLTVSVDGMKTTLRKKNRKRKKRISSSAYVDVDAGNNMVITSHPIYRIFYVSHDSQDVKIFSYIARETSSNVFHCCVFKAANKNQAMRIVRTVGQAFEVCHKLVGHAGEEDESEEVHESDTNLSSQLDSKTTTEASSSNKKATPLQQEQLIPPQHTEPVVNNTGSSTSLLGGEVGKPASSSSNTSTPPAAILASALTPLHHNQGSTEIVHHEQADTSTVKVNNKPRNLDLSRRDNISQNDLMNLTTPGSSGVPTPTQSHSFFKEITINNAVQPSSGSGGNKQVKRGGGGDKENLAQAHEAQLLKEQLEQQTQNTRAALAQIQLLRDQLAAESAARIEAQARTHQLLIHNKELLDHLQTLVRHIQELESAAAGSSGGMKDRSGNQNNMASATAAGVTLPQLTPRSKIERWFSFVVPPTSPHHDDDDDDVANPDEDDVSFLAADFESLDKAIKNLRLSRRTLLSNKESGFVSETNELTESTRKSPARAGAFSSSNKKKNKSGGSRAVVIKSGLGRPYRHHNHHLHHHNNNPNHYQSTGLRNGNRLSSTSSWLRRVLRLKRSSSSSQQESRKKLKNEVEFCNTDAQSTSTGRKRPSPSLQRVNSSKSRVSDL